MTALLEFKQKIKGLFAQYEVYVMPLLKFILALVYFIWINSNMGYMRALDNIFIVLILALICSVLPTGMIIFAGCAMMVAHCYALGIEVAGFMLVILLFMLILFLRFSAGKNIVMVFTPLAFAFDLPALLPIGCGLLSSPVSALPASGGVIIYYFIRYVRIQSQVLMSQDTQMIDKLTLLSDGIMKNGEMWLTLITFVVVILAVQLIRTRQFDYAWRIAIIAGGVIYLVLMLAGSMYFGLSVPIATRLSLQWLQFCWELSLNSLFLAEIIPGQNAWNTRMTITITMSKQCRRLWSQLLREASRRSMVSLCGTKRSRQNVL